MKHEIEKHFRFKQKDSWKLKLLVKSWKCDYEYHYYLHNGQLLDDNQHKIDIFFGQPRFYVQEPEFESIISNLQLFEYLLAVNGSRSEPPLRENEQGSSFCMIKKQKDVLGYVEIEYRKEEAKSLVDYARLSRDELDAVVGQMMRASVQGGTNQLRISSADAVISGETVVWWLARNLEECLVMQSGDVSLSQEQLHLLEFCEHLQRERVSDILGGRVARLRRDNQLVLSMDSRRARKKEEARYVKVRLGVALRKWYLIHASCLDTQERITNLRRAVEENE